MMSLRRRLSTIVPLLGLTIVLSLVGGVAPAAQAYEPPAGAIFNDAEGTSAQQYNIIRTVNAAIRNARKGSKIYISAFLFDNRGSADALIAARNRGVEVQVVIDGGARNGVTYRVQRALNRDNRTIKKGDKRRDKEGNLRKWGRDHSFLRFCREACRGPGDPNHTKFYVFTKTGSARNVVMISSSNLNGGGASKGYNDLMVLKDREKLVKDFASVHAEMAEDSSQDGDGFLEFERGSVTARFFPKRKAGDPVMEDLGRVRCTGANGGAGRGGKTAINISMFRWNNARGIKIARKLVAMDRNGCDVKIVYGAPGRSVVNILRDSARSGGVELYDSRYDYDLDGFVDMRIHHKYLLVNGVYGKDKSAWMVQTGSANWGQSLHSGDENTVNVLSRPMYREYIANWRWVTRTAARRVS